MSEDHESSEALSQDSAGSAPGSGPSDAGSDAEPVAQAYQRFDCTVADPARLAEAAEAARVAIEQGECIVLPTDTVYGIGADAFNADAVQRLLDAKVRGRDMPPPVLIADSALIRVLAIEVPQSAKDLVAKHWPGPLTVICKAQPSLRMDLGEAEGTIALRVPDHPLTREVLRRTGPMAVSSANISGLPPSITCDEAIGQLGETVAVYLDGGRLPDAGAIPSTARPSTIVDFSQSESGAVLRHGVLSVDLLRQTCPELEDLVEAEPAEPEPVRTEPAPDQEEPTAASVRAAAASGLSADTPPSPQQPRGG